MKSPFIPDLQNSSDSDYGTFGNDIFASFAPWVSYTGGNPLANVPLGILPPAPTLASQTVASSGGPSNPNSIVAVTTGGITINLLFDAAAMAAPSSFRAGIQQAASLLTASISDKITVNINIDYSGTGGGASAGPDHGLFESYSSIRADLINNATPGDTIFNALPKGSSIQGQSSVAVWNAQLKLFGFLNANDTSTNDGSATFATDINGNLLVGVALHELTHALGRVPFGVQPDIFDLFRFTSAGARLFTGGATAAAAYFSVDGGNTKLADFGQTSDSSDFLNSGVQGANDPFNEFYNARTLQSLTTVDKELLDALGFHTISFVGTTIEVSGSTSLVQVGGNYFLNSNSSGTGPELKYNGAAVTAGQFGAWTEIGAEQTSSGYEVAFKNTATNLYTVWSTDSSGNYIANIVGALSGTDPGLESFETSFHQDLNGDGSIGVPTTVIEASGSTSLVQVGNNYFLDAIGSGTGPELKSSGAAVTAGQFGAWTEIGAEQTSTGYEVAFKNTATNLYTVWSTDSSGNYTANIVGALSGTDPGLESFETSFHQDLNGDGVVFTSGSGSAVSAGSLVVGAGASVELTGAYSGTISFAASTGTLTIDNSANFSGKIAGQLAIGDVIDLTTITAGANATIAYSGNNSPGTLTVSDGTHTASLALLGNFSLANFIASSDGHGGTSVVDPPIPTASSGNAPSGNLTNDPVNCALNQQLALWSQSIASAFPSSAFSNGGSSLVSPSDLGGAQLSQLAQPTANHPLI